MMAPGGWGAVGGDSGGGLFCPFQGGGPRALPAATFGADADGAARRPYRCA
jgi:hypothetical protein